MFIFNTSENLDYSILLLDGGLGTVLEDDFHKDISHPLWSAKLVDEEGDIIIAAHLEFLRAGSQVILSSTYQASYETFRRAGYTDSEAEKLMCKSIMLAIKAREMYEQGSPTQESHPRAKIALSLGPFGATLETAAEFTGIYSPPYGPSGSQLSLSPRAGPFLESENESYMEALASFHFSRLLVYARNRQVWDAIDIVAFETVPLVTEAKAIRIAVARLQTWLKESTSREEQRSESLIMKPWWISFVFPGPNGEFAQDLCADREEVCAGRGTAQTSGSSAKVTRPYTAYEIARAALTEGEGCSSKMAVPDAIGINCTPHRFFDTIVEGFASAAQDISLTRSGDKKPHLVLYPNGGLVYSPIRKTWEGENKTSVLKDCPGASWAEILVKSVRKWSEGQVRDSFGGMLIGGCCKTGPKDIRALKSALTRS